MGPGTLKVNTNPARAQPGSPIEYSWPFGDDLEILAIRRRPTRLPEKTIRRVMTTNDLKGNPSNIKPLSTSSHLERPRASIIIVTYNKLPFTKMCLASILANTDTTFEVIVVDNASKDGTVDYLSKLSVRDHRVRPILQSKNLGFARANNLGISRSRGEILVILNNDTILSQGWLTSLSRHLDREDIGLVGPTTNRCGNEAEVAGPYRTYGEFVRFSNNRMQSHLGQAFEIPVLTMFCVAIRRETFRKVGELDEGFGQGLFEDEDYSIRVRQQGFRVMCAEDVYVHHFGQASFGELIPGGEHSRLFDRNRRRLEKKWMIKWHPYSHRMTADYTDLRDRIMSAVRSTLSPGSTVAIITRGDEELLAPHSTGSIRAWHFPRNLDGSWTGHYPANGREAVEQLETVRREGAEYLLIPSSGFWWLSHYDELERYLENHCSVAFSDESLIIFELQATAKHATAQLRPNRELPNLDDSQPKAKPNQEIL